MIRINKKRDVVNILMPSMLIGTVRVVTVIVLTAP